MAKKARAKSKGVYQDGRLLVIQEGASFPPACVSCSRSGDEEAVEFVFARGKAHVVEAAVVQSAARAVNDLVTGSRYTGPVAADIPLCPWCRGRRIRFFGAGFGLVLISAAYLAIFRALGGVILPPGEFGFLEMSLPTVIAMGLIFTGITLFLMALFDSSNLWFKAAKYHDRFVWVRGASSAYLSGLPRYADQHRSDGGSTRSSRGSYVEDEANLSAEELIRRANLDDE